MLRSMREGAKKPVMKFFLLFLAGGLRFGGLAMSLPACFLPAIKQSKHRNGLCLWQKPPPNLSAHAAG